MNCKEQLKEEEVFQEELKKVVLFLFLLVKSSLLKGCKWYINIFGIQRSGVFVAFFAGIHGFMPCGTGERLGST